MLGNEYMQSFYLGGGFKHFLFLPRILGKWSNSDQQIVQLGWFNHHLIIMVFIIVYTLPPRIMEVKNGCTSNSHYLSNTAISIIFRFHDYGRFRVVSFPRTFNHQAGELVKGPSGGQASKLGKVFFPRFYIFRYVIYIYKHNFIYTYTYICVILDINSLELPGCFVFSI